ncbi:MAG: CHAP domain-containing protein [Clostridia bacterium]|nr:CHAP domain-containing protein [Clostridia bacterium]
MNLKKLILRITAVILVISTLLGLSFSSFAAGGNLSSSVTVQQTDNSVEETEELPIADEIVNVARSKIGYYPSNINEFTTWYYGVETDAYWCSIFVSWCAAQVGAIGTAVPKRASCDTMRQWFINKGEYYPATSDYVPQRGDIVFINTAVDGTDDVHHVEIVTESGFFDANKNPKVKCIGGNTSDINYNGSEYVTEKTRPVNSSRATLVGYAHPSYEDSEGLMGSLYTLADKLNPSFVTYIFSKIISILPKLQIIADIFKVLFTVDAETPTQPVEPAV